jgi:hypothetical protein
MGDKLDHALALLKARATQLGSDEPEESVTVKGSELLFLHGLITSLREALEPFAKLADNTIMAGRLTRRGEEGTPARVTFADFRRARTALNPSRKETGI